MKKFHDFINPLFFVIIQLLVLCFALIQPTSGQASKLLEKSKWTTISPFGISVYAMEVDLQEPRRTIILTQDGLFRSTPISLVWDTLKFFNSYGSNPNSLTGTIAIDPSNSNVLYFCYGSSAIWQSVDGGVHWKVFGSEFIKGIIYDIEVDPLSSKNIYVATKSGVFRTMNGGDTWAKIIDGVVYKIVLGKRGTAEIYFLLEDVYGLGSSLYHSMDGGQTTTQINIEFTTTEDVVNPFNNKTDTEVRTIRSPWVYDIRVSPNDANVIMLSCGFHGTIERYLVRSVDGGITWKYLIKTSFPSYDYDRMTGRSLAIFGNGSQTSVAWGGSPFGKNIFISSTDEGMNWQTHQLPTDEVITNALSVTPTEIYIVADGIYRTSNSGQTWQRCHFGIYGSLTTLRHDLPEVPINLAGATFDKTSFYASTPYGIWSVDEIGAKWSFSLKTPLEPRGRWGETWTSDASFINVVRDTSGNVLAHNGRGDLVRFMGEGKSVVLKKDFSPSKIFLNPFESDRIFAIQGNTTFKSDDAGFSWKEILQGKDIFAMAFSLKEPNTIWAGGVGLYKSMDKGEKWVDVSKTLNQAYKKKLGALSVRKIIFPSDVQDNIVLLLTDGVMISETGGQSWKYIDLTKKLRLKSISLNDIVAKPESPRMIYLSTDQGMLISRDGGENWKFENDGLLPGDKLNTMVALSSGVIVEGGRGMYLHTTVDAFASIKAAEIISQISETASKTIDYNQYINATSLENQVFMPALGWDDFYNNLSLPNNINITSSFANLRGRISLDLYVDENGKVADIIVKEVNGVGEQVKESIVSTCKNIVWKSVVIDGKGVKAKWNLGVGLK